LKLNLAPHVPDDIVDSVLQQFQPALERPRLSLNFSHRLRVYRNFRSVAPELLE
jgi:hypothetical protein